MRCSQGCKTWRVSVHFRVEAGSNCPSKNRDIIQSFLCETLDEAITTATAWKLAFPTAWVFYSEEVSQMIKFL